MSVSVTLSMVGRRASRYVYKQKAVNRNTIKLELTGCNGSVSLEV